MGGMRRRSQAAAVLSLLGINYPAMRSWRHAGYYVRSARTYRRRWKGPKFPLAVANLWPVLADLDDSAGTARGHYFHQDLWAARKVFAARPGSHVDIGSRLDGFVAHLLTFMPVTVLDVRPLASDVDGLTFVQADATSLDQFADGSIASLSCLHAAEHFGLGRYGDPVDPDACFSLMRALARVVQPGGRLYFSVPIGQERVEFNAHRVFDPQTILDAFRDLRLASFSAVDDGGRFQADVPPASLAGAHYACGLFEFTK